MSTGRVSTSGSTARVVATGFVLCVLALLSSCGGNEGKTGVALIIKTQSNPYFVSMQKDAQKAASKDNVKLTVAAGQKDGDTQTQITAIQNAVARGDKGILITTNGDAVNTALGQARAAGLFVIALDSPSHLIRDLGPSSRVTFAADGLGRDELAALPSVTSVGDREDGSLDLASDAPQRTLVGLVGLAEAREVELRDLAVLRPSLEDVFLRLTGRTLVD